MSKYLKFIYNNVKHHKLNIICRGFTLVELMIVMAIIGIFSSLTIVNFRGTEKIRAIDHQSLLLLDGIKRIQTSSLSGKVVDNQVPIAYRLKINKCSADCYYDLSAKTATGEVNIDHVLLEQSAVDIVSSSGNSLGNNLVIEISPPRSNIKIYINDNPIIGQEVLINLQHTDNSSISKNVRINSLSGRIDILGD